LSYFSQLAVLCAINVLLAVAAYLPLTSGCLLICLGATMGAGAMADGLLGVGNGLNPLLGLLIGAGAGGTFMLVVALLLRRQSGFLLALGSVAIAEFARAVAEMSPALGGALGFSIAVPRLHPLLAAASALTVIVIVLLFERSLVRKGLSLGVQDPRTSASVGFNLAGVRGALMVASGAIAGAAGSLYIRNIGLLDPRTLGFEGGLLIATFAVVGGRRTPWGAILAALALTLIPEWLRFSAANRSALYGALLLITVLLRFSPFPGLLWTRVSWQRT
jgi:branched-chain amino acid transport system permease protein